jgi:hypothetical protein
VVVDGSIDVPRGRCRLRTAIVAGDRVGTLELPLDVGLRALGETRASDLVVGVVAGGCLEPRWRLAHTSAANALVELSSGSPLSDLSGYIVLTPAAGGALAARRPLAFRARSDDKGVVIGETAIARCCAAGSVRGERDPRAGGTRDRAREPPGHGPGSVI